MSTEQRIKAAQAYADAYRNWHGGDYSASSMIRFRATRDAMLAAFPKEAQL